MGQSGRLQMTNLFNQNMTEHLNHQIQLLKEYPQYLFQNSGQDYLFHLPQWEKRFLVLNILKDGQYKIIKLGMLTMNSFDNLAPRCGLV